MAQKLVSLPNRAQWYTVSGDVIPFITWPVGASTCDADLEYSRARCIKETYWWLRQAFKALNSSLQLHTAENTRPLQQSAYACACCLHSSMAFCLSRKSSAACTNTNQLFITQHKSQAHCLEYPIQSAVGLCHFTKNTKNKCSFGY